MTYLFCGDMLRKILSTSTMQLNYHYNMEVLKSNMQGRRRHDNPTKFQ